LEEEELITRKGGKLWPTRFGKRVSDLYIDPLSAVLLRQAVELADGMEEVTPLAWLTALASTPDLPTFFLRRTDYRTVHEYAQQHRDEFLVHDVDEELDREDFLAEVKTAMMFEDWVLELSEDGISVKYGIGPGDIRAKVDAGRWLTYAAREVARLFDHRDLTRRLRALERRVSYGVREELLPLVALRGVGRKRARALYAKGHRRVSDLREATVDELAAIPGIGPRVAASILEQAAEGRRGRDYSGTTFEDENGVQEEVDGGEQEPVATEATDAGEDATSPENAAAQMSLASFGGEGGEGDG
jgi:helicase